MLLRVIAIILNIGLVIYIFIYTSNIHWNKDDCFVLAFFFINIIALSDIQFFLTKFKRKKIEEEIKLIESQKKLESLKNNVQQNSNS